MNKGFFVFVWIVLLFPPARAQQYSTRQYTVLDGLPQSQVNMVLEDKNGYLWIGTHGGGLARFDGRDFKVYTTRDGLLSNVVHYLKLDTHQNLWIVHPRGITKFNGVDFVPFQPVKQTNSFRRVRRVFELNDSIFFMTNQGMLGKIYQDSIYYWDKPVHRDKIIRYAHLLPSREIALYLNDSSFLVRTRDSEYSVKHSKYFSHLVNIFNVGKEVWVETDRGSFTFDYRNKIFIKRKSEILNHVVQYDSSERVFWTRQEDNLLKERIDDAGHTIDTVLRDVNITQVFLDSEGDTWFGSSGNGLYKYFIQDFDRCASKKLTEVFAITKDKTGASWIGSGNKGLWKMSKGKVTTYNLDKVTENGVMTLAVSPSGEVWAGAFGGLGRYDPNKDDFQWYTRTDGLTSPYINQIDFDEKGRLWFATNGGGVGVMENGAFFAYSEDGGLNSRNATSVRYFPFDGSVFVGTDNGLNVIRNGKVLPVEIDKLENTTIFSLAAYQENKLLIGSGGAGVIVYDVTTKETKILDTDIGLPSDFIYFVGADAEDLIWVGTEKGITKIRLSDKLDIEEILHFGFDNGLAGVETNVNAYYLGEQKFFGLIDGIYQYNDLRNEGWKSFDLHLTDIEIFNGQVPAREYSNSQAGFFKIPEKLSLPSDKNHITFRFNRVDKRYPNSVRYQYFLKRWDKTWSMPTTTNHVTYSNLPPGDYEFQVKATSNRGSWSKEPLSYSFTIEAPFYQTAAFQVLVAVALAGGIGLYLFYRVRSRFNKIVELQHIRQQEQDSLRKEIARDFHDEMGNQLTRIINYISLMKLNGNGHSLELYNKVEDSAKYLYNGTRDFIWSIDPVNDELSKLFIHIRDFGDKLFNEKDISFRAFNEVKERQVTVPYGFSREVNLIFKEAMTNSFNHSQAKNVSFTLKQDGGLFEMILEDDGRGFELEKLNKVNGMKNMKNRADRIDSQLVIESRPEKGTRIKIVFSINKKKVAYEFNI
jgi:ligand-binding sensor domain-containing protein/signal transduction histidine kinase